jgi:cold shock CspA family protein
MQAQKGKLARWIEEKGFGFIKPDDGGADIFIHISALRGMSRTPVVGDVIMYETSFDDKGKVRAVNAKIEGVPVALTISPINTKNNKARSSYKNRQPRKPYNTYRPPYKKSAFRFIPILMVAAAVFAFDKFSNHTPVATTPFEPSFSESIKPSQTFTCQGKVYCSQMSSYDEAVFYLQNCPGTKMDGDGDGEPCEQQF